MKNKLIHKSLMAFFVGLLCAVSVSQAAVITLRSGNGVVPANGNTAPGVVPPQQLDPNVTMLVGAQVGDFATLTAAQFAAAAAGPAAYVVTPNANWISPALSVDPLAGWVTTNPKGAATLVNNPAGANSALYAISFNLTGQNLANAVLNLTAYADNTLGSAVNSGIYLNGFAIPNSTATGASLFKNNPLQLAGVNILPYLHAGVNTLYFDVVNTAIGPSGLLFSATITTTVPSSNVWSLLALGFLILVVMRNRKFVRV